MKKYVKHIKKLIVAIILIIVLSASYLLGVEDDIAPENSEASKVGVDERFGVGGSCNVLKALGMNWFYNWGWGKVTNNNELNCAQNEGVNIFYTVSKFDTGENFTAAELKELEDTYLEDQKARDDYDIVKSLAPKYGWKINEIQANFLYIPELAKKKKTHYWMIGNEPDFAPYITTDDYVQIYKVFSDRIRKYDSNAKISMGAHAFTRYNHSGRWDRKDLLNLCKYSQSEPFRVCDNESDNIELSGYKLLRDTIRPACKASPPSGFTATDCDPIIDDNAWVIVWREKFKRKFGEYPQVDFWTIHPYPWGTRPRPARVDNIQEYVDDSISSIDSFRKYMKFIGDSNKILWAKEFSLLGYSGECGDFNDCNSKSRPQELYMEKLINHLDLNPQKVQKWIWFYAGEEASHKPTNFTHDIFTDQTGKLNNLGLQYKKSMDDVLDQTNPTTQLNVSRIGQTNQFKFTINAQDQDSGIAEYWYAIGSGVNKDDIQRWKSEMTKSVKYESQVSVPDVTSTYYLNIRVEDAAGNITTKNYLLNTTSTATPATLSPTSQSGTSPTSSPTSKVSQATNPRNTRPTSPPSKINLIPEDLSKNGSVGIEDLAIFGRLYGSGDPSIDFNNNGVSKKDIGDFIKFAEEYRKQN